MGITTDNASNNNSFTRLLTTWANNNFISFNHEENHFGCFAHAINLSVQESLSYLNNELKQVNFIIIYISFYL